MKMSNSCQSQFLRDCGERKEKTEPGAFPCATHPHKEDVKTSASYRLPCICPCNWARCRSWGSRRRLWVSGTAAARRGISGPVCTRICTPDSPWARRSCCPRECAPPPRCCSPPARIRRFPHTSCRTSDPAQEIWLTVSQVRVRCCLQDGRKQQIRII